ncbi:MAG: hypothetical protein LKM37_08075 [Bacteroidales bacterium]|jgi:hypothetical protein|nr:hypothetical protein [Bacteroidales bacterium]
METNNFNGNMVANNDFESLEQMKQQMVMLKEKLDHQNVVNEKLILKSVKYKNDYIQKSNLRFAILGICAIPLCGYAFSNIGMYWWFIAYTMVMLIWSVSQVIINRVKYNAAKYIDDDLVKCLNQMIKAKLAFSRKLKIGICAISVFMLLFYLNVYLILATNGTATFSTGTGTMDKWYYIGLAIGGTVGAIIGAAIGFTNNAKQRRYVDEIIAELKGLQ